MIKSLVLAWVILTGSAQAGHEITRKGSVVETTLVCLDLGLTTELLRPTDNRSALALIEELSATGLCVYSPDGFPVVLVEPVKRGKTFFGEVMIWKAAMWELEVFTIVKLKGWDL